MLTSLTAHWIAKLCALYRCPVKDHNNGHEGCSGGLEPNHAGFGIKHMTIQLETEWCDPNDIRCDPPEADRTPPRNTDLRAPSLMQLNVYQRSDD
jgi:hypothetical protein